MARKITIKVNSSALQNLANLHLISNAAINLNVLQQIQQMEVNQMFIT